MAIRWKCQCGQPLVMDDGYTGRRVRCRQCGTEQDVPGDSSPEIPVEGMADTQPGAPVGYVYKMVQIPPTIECKALPRATLRLPTFNAS